MSAFTRRRWIVLVAVLLGLAWASVGVAQRPLAGLDEDTWKVGDLERRALVHVPKSADIPEAGAPLVFVFHGHGGNPRNVARGFAIHQHWPEAVVVYPEGLPTPGLLTDPEGKKPGWQMTAGVEGDRDLAFFDAMLASLTKKHRIDANRIYSTGHSNGGGFTYLLWQVRHERLAAVAPSAAGIRNARDLKPLPAMHLAGEKDPLVRYAVQERVMEAIREANGCRKEGKPWAERCTIYESERGSPVVTYIHPGGHEFISDSAKLIVRFFKEHQRKASDAAKIPAAVRAFYIGHSLNSDVPDLVAAIAKGKVEFRFREQFIPGAPLRWQFDEKMREAEKRSKPEPQFQGFWFDAFAKGDLTALVMIDSVPRGPKEMPETIEYAAKLIEAFAKDNPKGTVYLYEPWHCIKSGTPEGCMYDASSPTRSLGWLERLEADQAMWDEAIASLRATFPKTTIELIPAGRAFIALAKEISVGKVDGFKDWHELFDDDIHANPYGKYFVACVHYAVLTGQSPVGARLDVTDRWGRSYWNTPNWQEKKWAPPSERAVRAMQEIAWKAVQRATGRPLPPPAGEVSAQPTEGAGWD
jgi:polyhydroxybutyrate depolymerase